jgi:DNA-binding GntR family transcriptional regulator
MPSPASSPHTAAKHGHAWLPVDRVGDDEILIRHRTLPEQVADKIVLGIARGVFPAGEKLSEPLLVERLNVSRAPIREALRILGTQGIVISEPQRGHRVARFDRRLIEECYQVRRALEQTAVARAAQKIRRDMSLADSLQVILNEMRDHVERGDQHAMNRADLAFHSELFRLSGNEMLINIWRGLVRHVLIIFSLESKDTMETTGDLQTLLKREYQRHVALFAAIISARPSELAAEIERHLTFRPAEKSDLHSDSVTPKVPSRRRKSA